MAKVLIVDDEPDIRFMIRLIFEREGYEVMEAAHGAAALTRIDEGRPDLVITDMMMPVMDGAQLIERLRADPELAIIPILAVTGNPDRAIAADALLVKPFKPRRLVEIAASLIASGG